MCYKMVLKKRKEKTSQTLSRDDNDNHMSSR